MIPQVELERTGAVVDGEHAAADVDAHRAQLYGLLAMLMRKPPQEGVLARLREISVRDDDKGDLADAWRMVRLAAGRATAEAVDDEYHDLFIGVGRGELMPYGSWYMTGFLMDKPLAYLRVDLEKLGIERQEHIHEPEDHVAALCETMAMIIVSEDVSDESQRRFFGEHVAPWMGAFFRDLEQARGGCFYRSIGQLGSRFIDIESDYLCVSTESGRS